MLISVCLNVNSHVGTVAMDEALCIVGAVWLIRNGGLGVSSDHPSPQMQGCPAGNRQEAGARLFRFSPARTETQAKL